MKVVINCCYGGFSVSEKATRYMAERGSVLAQEEIEEYEKPLNPGSSIGNRWYGYADYDRNDPLLVEAVEVLGEEASGDFSHLKIVEIPDGVKFVIEEYDGYERVAEAHRTWS